MREQERLEWEAEERRRGQEHLDAILDQSGQILEVQRLDLVRESRSRSRSVSTHGRDRTPSASDDEEGTANASEDDGERVSDDGDESDASAEDEGIAMLVPDMEVPEMLDSASQAGGRSSRSASVDASMDIMSEDGIVDKVQDLRPATPPLRADASEASTSAVGTPKPSEKLPTSVYAERYPDSPMMFDPPGSPLFMDVMNKSTTHPLPQHSRLPWTRYPTRNEDIVFDLIPRPPTKHAA